MSLPADAEMEDDIKGLVDGAMVWEVVEDEVELTAEALS